jgi:hypothetical protein
MKPQDIAFCQQHIINFESVKLGFTRNISFEVLGEYERMYREYLDPQFILTYWCGECVFDMLKRLITLFELTLAAQTKVQIESAQPEVQKKRGRPKK